MSANLSNAVAENNALSILERTPIVDLPSDSIQCATCLLVHSKTDLKADGYVCRDCGDTICLMCGCTDSIACDAGCVWVEPGKCSSHR